MDDAHLKLLHAYAMTCDAEAFASIVDAYRDMVYSVCLRVLGNPADAEDVSQACFVTLARRAGEVRSSVAGWLHARATALSLTYLKRERNRRQRQRRYASHRPEESPEPNWEQIAPEVDQALLELPEDLREILVARFLQRKEQVTIATETGLSPPTVCRRIKTGLEALRSKLADRGVVASVVVLEVALLDHALTQAPQTLTASLGKLAMAGTKTRIAVSWGATFALTGVIIVAALAAGVGLTMHQAPRAGSAGGSTVSKPTSAVLRNLRPMVNWNLGQNYQINGYLQFQMECLGESKEYDYWFFAGVGGDSHTQVFTADTSKFCHSLSQIDFGPDFAKTLYDAVGYDFAYVTEAQFNADRPRSVGELLKCIDRGIPVIAKETGSSTRKKDKAQEFSLLVGYEESGGQLLFVEGDSTKPYRVPTNQHVSYLFVIPGAKKQASPLADVYRKAVLNIPALLTRPRKGDVSFGRQAFDAWAEHLLAEDYADLEEDNQPPWMQHTTYVCIVATNGSCRHFLDRAEKLCPDLPFIRDVNKEYAEMGRLWKDEMDATGGSFNATKATLRNKQAKKPIADFIRRYAACCDRILKIYAAAGITSTPKTEDSNMIGYNPRHITLPAFEVMGFTKIVASGGEQYGAVRGDGRWEQLRRLGGNDAAIYGVASHDKESPQGKYRYTVGVKATDALRAKADKPDKLFSLRIPESDWLVFKINFKGSFGQLWQDDPYRIIRQSGWDFNTAANLHMDVFGPSYNADGVDDLEFWMPVKRPNRTEE